MKFVLAARQKANQLLHQKLKHDLKMTAKSLVGKKYVPEHTLAYFTDKNMLNSAFHNYLLEPVKEYSCPNCMIQIRGPKAWAIQHVKKCIKAHPYFEQKDNELKLGKVNPYFY